MGIGGIVSAAIRPAVGYEGHTFYEVIAGLGGRDITKHSLHEYLDRAETDSVEYTTFLDLDQDLIDRELAREAKNRRSGAIAENMVRDYHERVAGSQN